MLLNCGADRLSILFIQNLHLLPHSLGKEHILGNVSPELWNIIPHMYFVIFQHFEIFMRINGSFETVFLKSLSH